MAVLVISEHDNISLKGATLNTIQAAREISFFMDAEVHVLVAGHRARAVAQAAGEVQGVTKVIHPDAEYLAHGLAENMAAQVLAIASMSPDDYANVASAIESELSRVIVGQRELIRSVVVCLLAEGHALLEGVPGLGKTQLLKSLSEAIDLQFSHLQQVQTRHG